MRIWVIPDIHGCIKTFRYLVEDMVNLQLDDKLYILGDMIDRGPDSKGVIDYIMDLEAKGYMVTSLRGNHEDYLLKVAAGGSNKGIFSVFGKSRMVKEWFKFGGEATLKSFEVQHAGDIPEVYINWLNSLPFYTSWDKYLIVHAGFNFKNDNIFADENAMMWIRDFEIDPEKLDGKKVIHGHVPVDLEFIYTCLNSVNYSFIALDNGVYMSNRPGYGNLTALELNTLDLKVQSNLDF
jgi:serine/threonine protein phosphatase 1